MKRTLVTMTYMIIAVAAGAAAAFFSLADRAYNWARSFFSLDK